MTPERARQMVSRAVRKGILIRPEECSRCGERPGVNVAGGPKIQGHHHDYNKPLDVEWLCAKCHRAETPLPEVVGGISRGEGNGQARLTEDDIRFIRESAESNVKIGRVLGVHHSTVARVRTGERWLHVDSIAKLPTKADYKDQRSAAKEEDK